jgi:hypothetical protein
MRDAPIPAEAAGEAMAPASTPGDTLGAGPAMETDGPAALRRRIRRQRQAIQRAMATQDTAQAPTR